MRNEMCLLFVLCDYELLFGGGAFAEGIFDRTSQILLVVEYLLVLVLV